MALLAEKIVPIDLPDWVYDILQDETEQRRFWITKGLGAGGTYGGAIWHYIMCLINHSSPLSWAIAPTYQQVADTLIPTFLDVLQNIFGLQPDIDFEVIRSGSPRIELLRTKQTIALKSANRPERMVGANISHCLNSEPGLQARVAYEKSSARLRCPKARRLQYLGEGTPEGLGNWYEQEANFNPGTDEANNKTRVVLWTDDNPHLSRGYIDQLSKVYSLDEHKLQSYRYGVFTAFTRGTAFWEFRHSRNVTLDLVASPQLPLIITWDWNHTPLAWVALQSQPIWSRGTKYDRYTVLGESSGRANGIMDACAEFIAQFDPAIYRDTPIEIDGGCDGYHKSHLSKLSAFDQVLQTLQKYYTNCRVVASKSAPRIQDRLQRHNALLAYRYLVMPAHCRNTIVSHEQTNLRPGTWETEKKQGEHISHWAEALGYALFRLTRTTDLINPDAKQIFGFN